MKNNKNKWLVMMAIFALFSGSAFAQTADHGSGNGGDGLDMNQTADSSEVTVPVPASFGQRGTLTVVGSPGAEQTDDVFILFCKTDPSGKFMKYGCYKAINAKLNQPIILRSGKFLVSYSNTTGVVEIKANQSSVINLATIRVAPDARPIKFNVFSDLTNPQMLKNFVKSIYTISNNESIITKFCTHPTSFNQKMCDLENSEIMSEYAKTIRLNKDGSYSMWDYSGIGWVGSNFEYVVDPKPGQFVSVMPGVYGIEFKDTESGEIVRQFGIVAK